MHKKFEINQTKIKGGCLSGRKVVTHQNSKSDLPLIEIFTFDKYLCKFLVSYRNVFSELKKNQFLKKTFPQPTKNCNLSGMDIPNNA